jgi:Transposase domain (DUF772)
VDGRPDHPPADPRILLALWLYATVEGMGSAREVARLCDEHIAFEWLCGGAGMNAKTLADFRVDHGAGVPAGGLSAGQCGKSTGLTFPVPPPVPLDNKIVSGHTCRTLFSWFRV